MTLKLTPLNRLTEEFARQLEIANDSKFEAKLAAKYIERLKQSAASRDGIFRALVIFDAVLLIVVTGTDVIIPETSIRISEITAITEVMVGLSSLTAYIAVHTFCGWLCYSMIVSMIIRRQAQNKAIDPDLIEYSEIVSEPVIKMMRAKSNIWGDDVFAPEMSFSVVTRIYDIANALFFIAFPIFHFALILTGIWRIFCSSGFDLVHAALYFWVAVSAFMSIFIWVVQMAGFSFSINEPRGN